MTSRKRTCTKFLELPDEVLLKISDFFSSSKTVIALLSTCKEIRRCFEDDKFFGCQNVLFKYNSPMKTKAHVKSRYASFITKYLTRIEMLYVKSLQVTITGDHRANKKTLPFYIQKLKLFEFPRIKHVHFSIEAVLNNYQNINYGMSVKEEAINGNKDIVNNVTKLTISRQHANLQRKIYYMPALDITLSYQKVKTLVLRVYRKDLEHIIGINALTNLEVVKITIINNVPGADFWRHTFRKFSVPSQEIVLRKILPPGLKKLYLKNFIDIDSLLPKELIFLSAIDSFIDLGFMKVNDLEKLETLIVRSKCFDFRDLDLLRRVKKIGICRCREYVSFDRLHRMACVVCVFCHVFCSDCYECKDCAKKCIYIKDQRRCERCQIAICNKCKRRCPVCKRLTWCIACHKECYESSREECLNCKVKMCTSCKWKCPGCNSIQ